MRSTYIGAGSDLGGGLRRSELVVVAVGATSATAHGTPIRIRSSVSFGVVLMGEHNRLHEQERKDWERGRKQDFQQHFVPLPSS